MNQDRSIILPNKPNLLRLLAVLGFVFLPLAAAQSPFRAQSRITMINFRNGEPIQTNIADIKMVVGQGKWCMHFNTEVSETETAVFFDGRNQHSVSRNKTARPGATLHGFIKATEVPYGGQFGQTAWFHFCKQRWSALPPTAFPNFMSYETMQEVSNLHLTLTHQADGFEAALDYVDGNTRWPVEKWRAEEINKATGVPKRSERVIYSRIGTFLNEKLLLPPPGKVYDKPLQIMRTEVSSIEPGDFPNDLTPTWHTNRVLYVTDKRFTTNANFISYTWTNGFPTERQIWADPYQRKQIQAILGVSKQDVR